MNKELNIGDYVRTRDGNIAKYIGYDGFYNFDNYVLDETKGINNDLLNEIVIKSSPNIIDLIEVGDYVNGDRVKALKGDIESHKINNEDDVIYTEYINDYDEWCGFEEDEIKSIVTKEQFESMKYKVGEKENENIN